MKASVFFTKMFFSFFFAVFFASGLVSSAGIVLNPFIGDDYEVDESQSQDQVLGPVRVILDTYHHKVSGGCVRVVYLQLAEGGKEFLDEFQASCDVHKPFTRERDVIDIKDGADVARLTVAQGRALWSVISASQGGGCVQRIYTDEHWGKLEVTAETKLSEQQCKQVMDEGRMLVPPPSPPTRRKRSATVDKLPELGETKGKVISLDDAFIDHYGRNAYQDVSGSCIKVTVEERHQFTGNCATFVHIDTTLTEDCLDNAQLTCDNEAAFYVGEGMVVFGGLVYIRDQAGEPIWAVYVMEDHCVLRVFTDKEQMNLVANKDRKLTWDQCKQVLTSKDLAWLPELTAESTSPTGMSLAGLKFLTGSRTSLTPSATQPAAEGSKKTETNTPAAPVDNDSLLGRILSWGSSWRAEHPQTPSHHNHEGTAPVENQGAAATQKWFFWL